MGKGEERGKRSRPLPSSILETSSSPQDFFFDSLQLSVSFYIKDGGRAFVSLLALQNTPCLQARHVPANN